jgi:uncharacterized membrane protein YqjE
MVEPPEHNSGVTASLHGVVETLVRTVQNRAELVGLEIEQEGRWLLAALTWLTASMFLALLALTCLTITIVLLFSEAVRPWILLGFSVLYATLTFVAVKGVMKHFRERRPPLADTVNELKKDLDWIRSPE